MSSLLATKLHRPSIPPKRVQRLDEGLESGRQIALVSAPAGFGKTTCISEWVNALDLPLAHPNFSLQVVLIQEEQVRRYDDTRNPQGAFGSWRRKGWVTHERRLLQVVGQRLFETPRDMLAQKMAYCSREMGAVTVVEKRGRGILYARPAA